MRLTADKLAGERGGEPVFEGISFSIGDGQSLVVTGPNGSGKSTLLRIVAGLLSASGGRIDFEGDEEFSVLEGSVHYLGHQNGMKAVISVEENLSFWRRYQGHPHLEIPEALEMVGMGDVRHLPFGYLSTGQRRRVAIAKLLVSYRPVWLLDEPTAGLDSHSEKQFAALLEAHRDDGGMIIAATHAPLGLDGAQTLDMGKP